MSITSNNLIVSSFQRINWRYLLANPMLALVSIIGCMTAGLLVQELTHPTGHFSLYAQLNLWIWLTVWFSALADTYAQLTYNPQNFLATSKDKTFIKIEKLSCPEQTTLIKESQLRSGYFIILKSGDMVPLDGTIVSGECYVNKTGITGSLSTVYKTTKKNRQLVAGSVIEDSQGIIMRINNSKVTLANKMRRLLKRINRQALPSEQALQRLILGLSVLFITIIFVIWVIARYAGFKIPMIFALDLIVILLPTTISGLQHAIITFCKSQLYKNDIIVKEHIALENIVDVNVLLLDKTGTITTGKRQVAQIENFSQLSNKQFMRYLWLASKDDITYEGQSICTYVKKHLTKQELIIPADYQFSAFSSNVPISGCNYQAVEIRKGNIKTISKYADTEPKNFSNALNSSIKSIAKAHGTPLLVTLNRKIIGLIHLRDSFYPNVASHINKFKQENIRIILITGDNELTANHVAKTLGIEEVLANALPDKKLEFVRKLQRQGYIVAMCGDGYNDSLALAQADVGFSNNDPNNANSNYSNVVSSSLDLATLWKFRQMCRQMTVKRGTLTVFSLFSDIAKYFVIVPALFTTAFPPLAALNFMHFHSLESIVLASVMFNALVILLLIPLLFSNFYQPANKYSLLKNTIIYSLGGLISPFIGIKVLEYLVIALNLV